MLLNFEKYQGTGNDFILIDNREGDLALSDKQLRHLCDRKFGIGSDGLILLEHDEDSDFFMNFYNPDASQSFCGNGSRCAVAYAISKGIVGESCSFKAIDGMHEAQRKASWIHIKMRNVEEVKQHGDDLIIDTGSPHYIRMVDEVDDLSLLEEAHHIRYAEPFKREGINVNFVETISTKIKMRTYERGVEDETLSCGTGVTAAALAFAIKNGLEQSVDVQTRGGELKVYFEKKGTGFRNVWLCGPAKKVFEGSIDVDW